MHKRTKGFLWLKQIGNKIIEIVNTAVCGSRLASVSIYAYVSLWDLLMQLRLATISKDGSERLSLVEASDGVVAMASNGAPIVRVYCVAKRFSYFSAIFSFD